MKLIYSVSLTIFKLTILMPSINVSREVYERLRRIAEEEGLSYSEVIRRALENNENNITRLVEAVEEIAATLKGILRVLEGINSSTLALAEKPIAESISRDGSVASEGLPPFVKDNPWLEVLRSRGKD